MPRLRAFLYSRGPVFLGVATIGLILAVGVHFRGGLVAAWHMIKVPALSPSFADTRTITGPIDCVLAGTDPYSSTCQPWGQHYNYPIIWLDLRYLGITSRSTDLLGCLFGLMSIGA